MPPTHTEPVIPLIDTRPFSPRHPSHLRAHAAIRPTGIPPICTATRWATIGPVTTSSERLPVGPFAAPAAASALPIVEGSIRAEPPTITTPLLTATPTAAPGGTVRALSCPRVAPGVVRKRCFFPRARALTLEGFELGASSRVTTAPAAPAGRGAAAFAPIGALPALGPASRRPPPAAAAPHATTTATATPARRAAPWTGTRAATPALRPG